MSRFSASSILKRLKSKSYFSWLSFQGKIYTVALIFLVGILLESALILTIGLSVESKVQKFYQVQDQSQREIHHLADLSGLLLQGYRSSLDGGTLVETSDLRKNFSNEMKNVRKQLGSLAHSKKDRASVQTLVRNYRRLDHQLAVDNQSLVSPIQYSRIKTLNHQYILSLKNLDRRFNQSSKGWLLAIVYQGWALLFSLIIAFLVFMLGRGLLTLAVNSITKPARLMSETLEASKQQLLNVELPEMSQDGLGNFTRILKDSLRQWNCKLLDSKNSINHFDLLCKELVTEIRKTELFAIQLQKVAEELNDNIVDETQLIESVHNQLTVMMNNGVELQKIPQYLTMIHNDLKNQLTGAEGQIRNILSQNNETYDESIEITDLAGNLHEASEKVKGVISILNDVSERTELLAFNTAIQAARAGDKGLGFGVVAKEIAKLVDYSKKASMRLSDMLVRINGKNEDILDLIHQYSKTSDSGLPVYEEVSKICDDLFAAAQTNFENIEKLTTVMGTLLMKSNQLSNEISQTIRLTSEENISNFDFDLETLDYQLNVKEANRIAVNVSELSDELRNLAETAATGENL